MNQQPRSTNRSTTRSIRLTMNLMLAVALTALVAEGANRRSRRW